MISIFLLAGLFSGCSKNTEPSKGSQPEPTSENGSPSAGSSSESTLEPVTLDWYMGLWVDYPETSKVMEAVSKIIKEKLNTTVNFHVYSYADYGTKVSTMLSAGQPMDILFLSPDTVPFLDNAQRGAFYPLEDLLPKYAPNIYASIPKGAWNAVTVNDHIYGVVPMKDLADSIALFYDTKFVEENNLNVPQPYEWTTLYDLKDFIYEAKNARDKIYPELANQPAFEGVNLQYTFFSPYEEIVAPVGITIPGMESFEGKGSGDVAFNVFDTPEYLEFALTMRQFVKDGLYPKDAANFNKDRAINLKSGWDLTQGELVPNKSLNPNYEISESNYNVMSTAYVRAMLNAVSANSKNPERALMVLDLVNTDPYISTMLRFGIENEHWKKAGDNQITFTGTPNEDPSKRAYYHWYGAQWGSMVNMFLPEDVSPELPQKIQALVEKSNQQTSIGFVFDSKPVQNEIAACRNVVAEYHEVIRLGMLDDVEKNVKEFVAKLKENGSQKIVDEVQKQLTAWRASVGR